ncbi:hypothetical protein OROHE_009571 [Orobanche hederae]
MLPIRFTFFSFGSGLAAPPSEIRSRKCYIEEILNFYQVSVHQLLKSLSLLQKLQKSTISESEKDPDCKEICGWGGVAAESISKGDFVVEYAGEDIKVWKTKLMPGKKLSRNNLGRGIHDSHSGCNASILLDEAPSIQSEKIAVPNNNFIRGFDVIEAAKHEVERACPGVVSYAHIYASIYVGGPSWTVRLGRRDSTTASRDQANTYLPSTFASLDVLISSFASKGLSARDMVALSAILHCPETGFEKLEQDSILGQPNIYCNSIA